MVFLYNKLWQPKVVNVDFNMGIPIYGHTNDSDDYTMGGKVGWVRVVLELKEYFLSKMYFIF